MKKKYATPRVEKIEFSYQETVTASNVEYVVPCFCCRYPDNNNNNTKKNNSADNNEMGDGGCWHVNNSPEYWGC